MKLLAFTLGTIVLSTSAFAGGYAEPVMEPTPAAPVMQAAPSNDWTGFYAGLQYGQGSSDISGMGESAQLTDFDAYGVHAGYLRDLGQFILGGEFDYNMIDTDAEDIDGDLMRLRARAGYDMGKFQPYLTAGVARVSLDSGDESRSETGFTYGIGADYLVTSNISLGLEYSRSDFSDVLEDEIGAGIDLETDMIQVRATYRF